MKLNIESSINSTTPKWGNRSKLKKLLSLTLTVIMLLTILSVFHSGANASTTSSNTASSNTVTYLNQWTSWTPQQIQFTFPFGIAVAPNGNVYVADSQNGRIQELSSAGEYVTQWSYAGADVGNMGHPQGVAVDSSGNVYVVDANHNRVEKFTADGQLLTYWGGFGFGNGQFDGPVGIAIDPSSGNVYVSDWDRIEEFTNAGTYIAQWGSYGHGSSATHYNFYPQGIAVDNSGNVYVADSINSRVLEFTASGASFVRQFGPGSGSISLNSPYGVAVDSSGNVYVVDMGNNFVIEFSNSGGYINKFGHYGPQNGNFTEPIGIALDGNGHVYVSCPGYTSTYPYASQDRVQVFTTSGTYIATWGRTGVGNDHFISPNSVTLANGNVYVANGGAETVDEFSLTGTHLAQFGNGSYGSASNELWNPFGAAVDSLGNVYISDTDNNRIVVYWAAGGTSTWGSYGISWSYSDGSYDHNPGKFNEPMGIAIGKDGNIYVADESNSRIQEFSPTGTFITQWGGYGSGNTQLAYPRGLAIDSSGNVYVVDEIAARVQEFTSDGTYITQWGIAGTGIGQLERPSNIAVDSNGNVFVSDMDSNRITEFTSTGVFELQWGNSGYAPGQTHYPMGVASDGNGKVYVTDNGVVNIFSLTNPIMHTVTGTVTDSSTSQPIAGATVTIRTQIDNSLMQILTTDANGNFQTTVSENTLPLTVLVQANGYTSEVIDNVAPSLDGSLQYSFGIVPTVCQVSGTVVDSDTNTAISGATIVIDRQSDAAQLQTTTTDVNGQYTATVYARDLPITVAAQADGYAWSSQANLVQSPDGNVYCDFSLGPVLQVNFSVTDAVTGRLIPASEVTFTDNYGTTYVPEVNSGANWGLTTLTADQFPLTITLATASGYQDMPSYDSFTVYTAPTLGTVETINISLQPINTPSQVTLNLQVQDSDGNSISNAQVYYGNQPDWWLQGPSTDYSGAATIQLWDSDFPITLQVSAPGYVTQTVTVDNSAGGNSVTTDVQLQMQSQTLEFGGLISDGSTMDQSGTCLPVANAQVTLDFGAGQPVQTVYTNSAGYFLTTFDYFPSNPNAAVRVTVSAPGYVPYSENWGCGGGHDTNIDVLIYPPSYQFPISFHVFNFLTNAGVPFAQIFVSPNNGAGATRTYTTDANGDITIYFHASDMPFYLTQSAVGYQEPTFNYLYNWIPSPANSLSSGIPLWPLVTSQVQSATGTGTAYFTPSLNQIDSLSAIAPNSLPTTGLPAGITFPDGLFSFTIPNLLWGQTVKVNITLPNPVPPGSAYWEYDGATWTSIPIDSINGNTITITLTDGGQGDTDHTMNGIITDPGGVGVNPPFVLPESSLGTVMIMVAMAMAMMCMTITRKLHHRKQ